ncbi:MAG: 4Fe-4S binding protein [Fidelibacterota bacterium]|nr:MAG: 4Fe-4S binding protein [Candidatus Neomarinimicrobiota bacterium]
MAGEVGQYFQNIGAAVSTLWDGMRVTMGHFIRKKKLNATLQYPRERWPIPERHIGFEEAKYNVIRCRLHVDIDDCIGCMQCVRACPVDCIKIETIKLPKDTELGSLPGSTQTSTTSNGSAKRLLVSRFDIDLAECMYCNLCTFPCPEECIYMVGGPNGHRHPIDYEFSERDRNRLVYQFATATDEEVEQVSKLLEAAAAVKKPAPVATETAEKAPEKKDAGEKEIDLSILNTIEDRIARSKAKVILNQTLRQGKPPGEAVQEIRNTLTELGKLDDQVEAVLAQLGK